jgi:hypothetical protein
VRRRRQALPVSQLQVLAPRFPQARLRPQELLRQVLPQVPRLRGQPPY